MVINLLFSINFIVSSVSHHKKVKYSLSNLGRSSLPILKSLHHWDDTKKRTINKVIENNYAEVVNL